MNPELITLLIGAGGSLLKTFDSINRAAARLDDQKDREEYSKILNTVLAESNYRPLEKAANRQMGAATRQLRGVMAASGLTGSSLETAAVSGVSSDIMAKLASDIQRDRQFRSSMGMDLYKTILNAKAQGEAADAQMWGGGLAGLGSALGTALGSDWFGEWLNRILDKTGKKNATDFASLLSSMGGTWGGYGTNGP